MRPERRRAFTLVELLVVIGIIAILMGILLPALGKARESGNSVKCAANLRNIGQGITSYLADNRQTFPPAYTYRPPAGYSGGADRYPNPTYGYIHWSSYIFGAQVRGAMSEAFKCPSLENGGLPPTHPYPGEGEDGQVPDSSTAPPDAQVARCAYTVNEALMPRNKFDPSIRGASTSAQLQYTYVKASSVKKAAQTILATEFVSDWKIVSEVSSGEPPVIKSHRPVSGYEPIMGKKSTDLVDGVAPASAFVATHQRVKAVANPATVTSVTNTLGWVGRNHGSNRRGAKGEDLRKTQFLYADGHVESKTIDETLGPVFEWGNPTTIYSLPGARVKK